MKIAIVSYEKRALPADWKPDDELLMAALRARGAGARIVGWRDPSVSWLDFDGIVLRSCWDSHREPETFRRWMRGVEATGPRLINRRPVLEWNYDKERYLSDLLAAFPASGAGRITPSRFYSAAPGARITESFESAAGRPLRAILDDIDRSADGDQWRGRDVVVKPTVSADGDDTFRIVRSGSSVAPGTHDALSLEAAEPRVARLLLDKPGIILQPFVDGIGRGEYSVVYVEDVATHAVHKRTGHDDFKNRSESDRVGLGIADLPPALRSFADRIWAHARSRFGRDALAYGRIDLVDDVRGRPTLMELELVDPNLQLVRIPEACGLEGDSAMHDVVDRLVTAITDRVAGSTAGPAKR